MNRLQCGKTTEKTIRMIDKVLPIVMVYEEKGVTEQVEACLDAAGFDEVGWVYAYRDGVGSMARAFNDSAVSVDPKEAKYLWFVTNVTFTPDVPKKLFETLENNRKAAAVHPAFDSSHGFIAKAKGVQPAHFIEWTAPMVRCEAFEDVGILDEDMPYVHFDLDWSHRAKKNGWTLLVDGRVRINHTYLHVRQPERISQIRAELRQMKHQASLEALKRKWGPNALADLCVGGNCG